MKKIDIIAVCGALVIQAASVPLLLDIIQDKAVVPLLMPCLFIAGLAALTVHSFVTNAAYVYKLANSCGLSLNISILIALLVRG